MLNPIIRGWANYHRNQVADDIFRKVDHLIWQMLWRWARRRHPKKSLRWVKDRYFHRIGREDWVFGAQTTRGNGERKWVTLVKARNTQIRRHVKIKGEANPFDPASDDYFERRLGLIMKDNLRGKGQFNSSLAAATGQVPALRRADHEGNGLESSQRPSGSSAHRGHATKPCSVAPELPSTGSQSWLG